MNLICNSLPDYLEKRYEKEFGEPWSALEARVRARHPDTFALLDSMEEQKPKRKWWHLW